MAYVDPLDALWNFDDPAGSEQEFREFLKTAEDPSLRAETLTQIARTLGLRRRFEEVPPLLEEARGLVSERSRPYIRILLEHGRMLNSSGRPKEALPYFLEAWELGNDLDEDELAVDAAHMVAIAEEPEAQIEWNEKAMAKARASEDPRARKWMASLSNNLGWTYYEEGEFEKALALFEEAHEQRKARGGNNERIARYCIGKCLRAMGRLDEALAIQTQVLKDHEAAGTGIGFVEEEIAWCLFLQGHQDQSSPYFATAYRRLSEADALFDEPDRLARLKELAGL
ncbi:MAG TPA: tetratricopeptide repeat protein [Fimbriimonas sp.]|nr:tetratricopeptide repeat protein [Fimbriimonas sp.]